MNTILVPSVRVVAAPWATPITDILSASYTQWTLLLLCMSVMQTPWPCPDRTFETAPKVSALLPCAWCWCQHCLQGCRCSASHVCVPLCTKWTPSFAVTCLSSDSLCVSVAVPMQVVVQHVSRTLKFVRPRDTSCRIRLCLNCRKLASNDWLNSLSLAFVQWPGSLQQRANKYRGNGGITTQAVSFFASSIGHTQSTIFLNISGGLTTILPPRWYFPWLRKGNEVDPSNCS